jgi:hypothetical protein
MPQLTDPVVLAQFNGVLANWNYSGYVTAKDVALGWVTVHPSTGMSDGIGKRAR